MEQSAVETKKREGKRSKMWIVFVIGAVLSWGVYGPALHKGQTQLGNPLKALLCVGFAYFLIGVLVPVRWARWGRSASSGRSSPAGSRIS